MISLPSSLGRSRSFLLGNNMPKGSARVLAVLLVLLAPALLVACSREANVARSVSSTGAARVSIPSQVLGLQVSQEDVRGRIEEVQRSYLSAAGLFSLREGELLRATLQVGRFNRSARPSEPSFQRSIIGLMGASTPEEITIHQVRGDRTLIETTVFATSGTDQNVFVWFGERTMYVLSVHQDYLFPRTLLRRLVQLDVQL